MCSIKSVSERRPQFKPDKFLIYLKYPLIGRPFANVIALISKLVAIQLDIFISIHLEATSFGERKK